MFERFCGSIEFKSETDQMDDRLRTATEQLNRSYQLMLTMYRKQKSMRKMAVDFAALKKQKVWDLTRSPDIILDGIALQEMLRLEIHLYYLYMNEREFRTASVSLEELNNQRSEARVVKTGEQETLCQLNERIAELERNGVQDVLTEVLECY